MATGGDLRGLAVSLSVVRSRTRTSLCGVPVRGESRPALGGPGGVGCVSLLTVSHISKVDARRPLWGRSHVLAGVSLLPLLTRMGRDAGQFVPCMDRHSERLKDRDLAGS